METLTPVLTIEMFLDEKVAHAVEASGLQASLAGACESILQDSLSSLGIPGAAQFQISAGIPPDWLPSLIVMNVNGQAVGSLPGGQKTVPGSHLGTLPGARRRRTGAAGMVSRPNQIRRGRAGESCHRLPGAARPGLPDGLSIHPVGRRTGGRHPKAGRSWSRRASPPQS